MHYPRVRSILPLLTMALAATGAVPSPYPPHDENRARPQASPEAQALAIRRAQEKRDRKAARRLAA